MIGLYRIGRVLVSHELLSLIRWIAFGIATFHKTYGLAMCLKHERKKWFHYNLVLVQCHVYH